MADGLVIELKLDGFAAYSEKAHAALGKALEAEGEAWVRDAQSRAPVATGYLRDHIVSSVDDSLTLTLESQAEYSAFQNYGTRTVPAHPFFDPALDQLVERLPSTVADALAEAGIGIKG